MHQNIIDEYSKKGFIVIKNLVKTDDLKIFSEIAKRHGYKSKNSVVQYFYDYKRFLDFRFYRRFFKLINLRYIFDCFF
tara:strand:- start:781 stop:1014 length:234 start_codon:yes stop_codon:yes gene_type:complete